MSKRISIRIRDPNPLFRLWLSEWANQADIQGRDHTASSIRRALTSLEKYPCPLFSGRDCMILDGFGDNICKMLDKKLAQHGNTVIKIPPAVIVPTPAPVAPSPKSRKPANPKISKLRDVQSQVVPGPSTSAATKRLKKTKSEQSLPPDVPIDSNPIPPASPTPAPVKPGAKRKATTAIDAVINEDVIMLPGTFEILLLVDSMETVG